MQKWLQKWLGFLSKPSESSAASVQLGSPFILGLDDVTDLETLSNENFLKLIQWDSGSQTSREAATLGDVLGNFPE